MQDQSAVTLTVEPIDLPATDNEEDGYSEDVDLYVTRIEAEGDELTVDGVVDDQEVRLTGGPGNFELRATKALSLVNTSEVRTWVEHRLGPRVISDARIVVELTNLRIGVTFQGVFQDSVIILLTAGTYQVHVLARSWESVAQEILAGGGSIQDEFELPEDLHGHLVNDPSVTWVLEDHDLATALTELVWQTPNVKPLRKVGRGARYRAALEDLRAHEELQRRRYRA